MQSMPVSPPPITITFLPRGGDLGARRRLAGRPALLRGDPAVALVQVVHREVDAAQLAAGDVEVAGDARADREHDRVEALAAAPRR